MKQIFIENYIGKPLEHEYNLSVNQLDKQTIYKLNQLNNQSTAFTIIDTGNAIQVMGTATIDKNYIGDGCIEFTYCQIQNLLILLTEHNKTKIEFRESITLKTI